mgnify:CR=1 FL=1
MKNTKRNRNKTNKGEKILHIKSKEIDNLYAMQNFAMQELWKVLEINKNKNN